MQMQSDGGFTLVEALVALLILSITLLGLLQGVSVAVRQIASVNEKQAQLISAQRAGLFGDKILSQQNGQMEFITRNKSIVYELSLRGRAPSAIDLEILEVDITDGSRVPSLFNFKILRQPKR